MIDTTLKEEENMIVCPNCRSDKVSVQVVERQKKRGCFAAMMWILLAICTCGLILLVPLITRKGSKTVTYAVCHNCGYRWKLK